MSYIESNLVAGEHLVCRAWVHWKVFIWPGLWLLAGLLTLAANVTMGLVLVLIASVASIVPYLTYSTSEFGLTNMRIIIKAGLIRRRSLEIQLGKVESIGVDQGMLGRMLRYGTIVITGTGGTEEHLAAIGSPFDFQRSVEEQLHSAPRHSAQPPDPSAPSSSAGGALVWEIEAGGFHPVEDQGTRSGPNMVLLAAVGLVIVLVLCSIIAKLGPPPSTMLLTTPTAPLTGVSAAVVTKPAPGDATPAAQPTVSPTALPNPLTAQEAIATVRASPDMSKAAAPFKQETGWTAEWIGDRWYVLGVFESPWGARFVTDATLQQGKVYAYIDYGQRPKREWIEAKARGWGLQHLYTRFTSDEALARSGGNEYIRSILPGAKVVDAVAELVEDRPGSITWRFAFYSQRADGQYEVLVMDGAREGNYFGGQYGFGSTGTWQREIPLHLVDWVRRLAKDRGWEKASNLQ